MNIVIYAYANYVIIDDLLYGKLVFVPKVGSHIEETPSLIKITSPGGDYALRISDLIAGNVIDDLDAAYDGTTFYEFLFQNTGL